MIQPLGVILAGGQATRMGGGDKGLLILGDRTILSHVIGRFDPQCAGLALNANGDARRFTNLNLPIIADSIPGFAGPLCGVLAGLDWAADQGASHIVTAAADTPFHWPPKTARQAWRLRHRQAGDNRRLVFGRQHCAMTCGRPYWEACVKSCFGHPVMGQPLLNFQMTPHFST